MTCRKAILKVSKSGNRSLSFALSFWHSAAFWFGAASEIEHAIDAELAVHRFDAGDPESRSLVVLLGFLAILAFERFFLGAPSHTFYAFSAAYEGSNAPS